jgi:DNA-binding NarL/FixJ family response regulator
VTTASTIDGHGRDAMEVVARVTSPSARERRAETRWRLGSAHAISADRLDDGQPALIRRGPTQLLALQQHLHGAPSLADLFTRASNLARVECGFSRALVVSMEGRRLTADLLRALDDPASDALRRKLLAEPLTLPPGSVESEFVRLAEGGRGETVEGSSVLQQRYGLEHLALGAVMPQDEVLALLIVDRARRPVTFADRAVVQGFAQLLTCSVERLVMRQRIAEFATELRYMTTSASALLSEGIESPITLPIDLGAGPVFTRAGDLGPQSSEDLRDVFTRRELSIAREIVAGKSNREIAQSLQISSETVKKYVSRVMRKLGAANRAEAAVRCVRLTGPGN